MSREAKKKADSLVYYAYNKDALASLEADLHNQKTNALVMRKMSMIWKKLKINTVKEYHDFLQEKWNAIYEAER